MTEEGDMSTGSGEFAQADVPKVNRFAWASMAFAALAMVSVWWAGIAVPAFFGIVAGHKALLQVKQRNERGASLARIALAMSDAVVSYVAYSGLSGVAK